VPLNAVNGPNRLTKLTTSKGQARPIRLENFRICQSLSNRIELDGRFEFRSNLEASQVPKKSIMLHDDDSDDDRNMMMMLDDDIYHDDDVDI